MNKQAEQDKELMLAITEVAVSAITSFASRLRHELMQPGDDSCPDRSAAMKSLMRTPGVQVQHERTTSGAALVVTTTCADVEEFRRRVKLAFGTERDIIFSVGGCLCCLCYRFNRWDDTDRGVRFYFSPVDKERLNEMVADYAQAWSAAARELNDVQTMSSS